jgi:DNA-binding transcriptional ArsR family regulator
MPENDIFKALADPTRRSIFEKLAAGSMHASALREGLALIAGWLAKYRADWPQRVDALKGLLKDMDQ